MKTSLVARALKRHPAMTAPEGGLPRYINARVPTPVTFKGMGTTLLQKSGYDLSANTTTAWQVWDKLRFRLKIAYFGSTRPMTFSARIATSSCKP